MSNPEVFLINMRGPFEKQTWSVLDNGSMADRIFSGKFDSCGLLQAIFPFFVTWDQFAPFPPLVKVVES